MDRPPLEVADLVRAAGHAFIERSRAWITWKHVKVLLAIVRCRTAVLGGHLDTTLHIKKNLRASPRFVVVRLIAEPICSSGFLGGSLRDIFSQKPAPGRAV